MQVKRDDSPIPMGLQTIELRSQMDTAGLGYTVDRSERKRKHGAAMQHQRRSHGSNGEDEENALGRRRVVVYPSKPKMGANSYEEQLRRWRMANDPSYVTIGTVYDHLQTNPLLLPPDYYDDAAAEGDQTTEQERRKSEEEEKEGEAQKRAKQEEERYRSAALRRVFHSKPFVRGGTIEEEREELKKRMSDHDGS